MLTSFWLQLLIYQHTKKKVKCKVIGKTKIIIWNQILQIGLPVLFWKDLSLSLADVGLFFSSILFLFRCHSLSALRMLPSIHCVNVIQFREMFAAAAKSHCYTLRHHIWEKPPNRFYNRSVQHKSCLVLIPRSSCSWDVFYNPWTCVVWERRWTHKNT